MRTRSNLADNAVNVFAIRANVRGGRRGECGNCLSERLAQNSLGCNVTRTEVLPTLAPACSKSRLVRQLR
jgi:hypothetical protein